MSTKKAKAVAVPKPTGPGELATALATIARLEKEIAFEKAERAKSDKGRDRAQGLLDDVCDEARDLRAKLAATTDPDEVEWLRDKVGVCERVIDEVDRENEELRKRLGIDPDVDVVVPSPAEREHADNLADGYHAQLASSGGTSKAQHQDQDALMEDRNTPTEPLDVVAVGSAQTSRAATKEPMCHSSRKQSEGPMAPTVPSPSRSSPRKGATPTSPAQPMSSQVIYATPQKNPKPFKPLFDALAELVGFLSDSARAAKAAKAARQQQVTNENVEPIESDVSDEEPDTHEDSPPRFVLGPAPSVRKISSPAAPAPSSGSWSLFQTPRLFRPPPSAQPKLQSSSPPPPPPREAANALPMPRKTKRAREDARVEPPKAKAGKKRKVLELPPAYGRKEKLEPSERDNEPTAAERHKQSREVQRREQTEMVDEAPEPGPSPGDTDGRRYMRRVHQRRHNEVASLKAGREASGSKPKFEINPPKNDGDAHHFNEVVRKKNGRKKLVVDTCDDCAAWYEHTAGATTVVCKAHKSINRAKADFLEDRAKALEARVQHAPRRRAQHRVDPDPPDYWRTGFPGTQRVEQINRQADAIRTEKRVYQEAQTDKDGFHRYRQT